VFGLQRAFHLGGARTVVTSLWKVPDADTQQLMARFYENLWSKKMGAAAALREAQLQILGLAGDGETRGFEPVKDPVNAHVARPSPWRWAAWVLSGDPGDLSAVAPVMASAPATGADPGETRLNSWLVYLVAGLVTSGLLGFFVWRRGGRQQAE
jgi:hypothetical protein